MDTKAVKDFARKARRLLPKLAHDYLQNFNSNSPSLETNKHGALSKPAYSWLPAWRNALETAQSLDSYEDMLADTSQTLAYHFFVSLSKNRILEISGLSEYWHSPEFHHYRFAKAAPLLEKHYRELSETIFSPAFARHTSEISALLRLLNQAVTVESVKHCDLIGWLHQYYLSADKKAVYQTYSKGSRAGAKQIARSTQIFTPAWISQCLVHNTVGRTHFRAGKNGEIKLIPRKEKLTYFLPADTRAGEESPDLDLEQASILDPACGSGHILIEAFNAFAQLYERGGYLPAQSAKLILQQNLRGFEIDPLAAQLARFALEYRAALYLRSHKITCPAAYNLQARIECLADIEFTDQDLAVLQQFCYQDQTRNSSKLTKKSKNPEPTKNTQKAKNLEKDFSTFWNQFSQLSLLGALVRPQTESHGWWQQVEEQIAQQIAQSNAQQGKQQSKKPASQSSVATNAKKASTLSLSESLQKKVEKFFFTHRQLSQKYPLIVANPPYLGARHMNKELRDFAHTNYFPAHPDLCTMFMQRCQEMLSPRGFSALVVSESWLTNVSFAAFRQNLLSHYPPILTLNIDKSAFSVRVNTAVCVFSEQNRGQECWFYHWQSAKSPAKSPAEKTPEANPKEKIFHLPGKKVDLSKYAAIPTQPFAFTLPDQLLPWYRKQKNLGAHLALKQGLATGDNKKFLRYWWQLDPEEIAWDCANEQEALQSGKTWFPYNKGGGGPSWFTSQLRVINWGQAGREIREFARSAVRNPNYFFRPSLSWSNIGTGKAGFRFIPQGHIFDVAGMSLFPTDRRQALVLLSFLNSNIISQALEALAPTLNYQVGDVAKLPWPGQITETRPLELAEELLNLHFQLACQQETSPYFRPDFLPEVSLAAYCHELWVRSQKREEKIRQLESENDAFWAGFFSKNIPGSSSFSSRSPSLLTSLTPLDSPFSSPSIRLKQWETNWVKSHISASIAVILGRFAHPYHPDFFYPNTKITLKEVYESLREYWQSLTPETSWEKNLGFVEESLQMSLENYLDLEFYPQHLRKYFSSPLYELEAGCLSYPHTKRAGIPLNNAGPWGLKTAGSKIEPSAMLNSFARGHEFL